jgi:translation initiation factor IF-3
MLGGGAAPCTRAGLDPVEVNPTAQPPVCKILDIARFKYEEV